MLLGFDRKVLRADTALDQHVTPVRGQSFFLPVAVAMVFPHVEAEGLSPDGNPGICDFCSRPPVNNKQCPRIFQ